MIKSPNDKKNYHSLTLDNGLRVLLIENMESQKAAAALAVNVGHFSDPADRQGMAHFLEHMLFLGTKHFPDGSEYQQFIAKHGGHHNAWTATEHTCFFLDIFHQQFDNALERFSDFFITPLLDQGFIEKERQNIDAEFKLKLKDDVRRLYDVHKETINSAHPFAKFSVGNIDTLADRKDQNVRDELISFYQTHYFAENMTLALEGPYSIAQLSNLAIKYFSKIKSNPKQTAQINEKIYQPEHQQIKIDVCPVKDDRQLIISFAMPCLDEYYECKPDSLIAYLIGHEGPGSLLSYLKNKQWALRLSAGSGIHGSNFKDFNISIALTELGEKHINDIVSAFFSYIALLTNNPIDSNYYDEKKAIAALSFNFQEKAKPIESVSHLVMNMQYYPSEHYIYGDYMMTELNQQLVTHVLSFIEPTNMRITHIAKGDGFDRTSFWYQVPYRVQTLPKSLIEQWAKPEVIDALQLPEKNPYIVKEPQVVVKEKTQHQPNIILQEKGLRAWFKQDQSFNIPKGYIYLNIDSPFCISSAKNIAMTRLFINLFTDNVTEEHYNAELAGMHYHLYPHQSGMTVQISGLSEKQPRLLAQLLYSLHHQAFCFDKFELFRKQLIKYIRNTQDSKSISQLFSSLSSQLQPNKLSNETYIEELTHLTFDDFISFYQSLFQSVFLELFIHGNWQLEHANEIIALVKCGFEGLYTQDTSIEVPVLDTKGEGTLSQYLQLNGHDHAAITYFALPDKSIKTMAYAMVISQLLSPHFFEQMRTEKQYGYLVGVGYVPTGYYPGIALYIQSPHTDAEILSTEIETFILSSQQLIGLLSEQDWHSLRRGLAGQLLEKDASLRVRSQRFWASITSQDIAFNNKDKLIEAIETMELASIKSFINQFLLADAENKIASDHLRFLAIQDAETLVKNQHLNNLVQTSHKLQKTGKIKF